MAYVRKRGRQLARVHGQRNPDTQKVEQPILFMLYSKSEAREAIGKQGKGEGAYRFNGLLERRCPDIRFDRKKIRKDDPHPPRHRRLHRG